MDNTPTIQIDDALTSKLDDHAALLDRSRAWVIERAIAHYIEEFFDQDKAIARSPSRYRTGEATLPAHDAVMERISAKFDMA